MQIRISHAVIYKQNQRVEMNVFGSGSDHGDGGLHLDTSMAYDTELSVSGLCVHHARHTPYLNYTCVFVVSMSRHSIVAFYMLNNNGQDCHD